MPPPPPKIETRAFLRQLDEYYRPFYGVIGFIGGLMVMQEIVGLLSPYLFGKIVDGLMGGLPFERILLLALLSLTAYLAALGIDHAITRIQLTRLDWDLSRSIVRKAMERIFSLSIGQHTHEHSAIRQNVVAQGQSALTELLGIVSWNFAPIALQSLAAVVAITFFDPLLGAIVGVGVVLHITGSIFLVRKFYPEVRENKELSREHEKKTSEFLRQSVLIKANSMEDEVIRAHDTERGAIDIKAKDLWVRNITSGMRRLVLTEIVRFLVVAIGSWLVITGKRTTGDLVIYLAWSTRAFNGLGRVPQQLRHLLRHYESLERYFKMLATPPAVVAAEKPISLSPLGGKIAFDNVSFAYRGASENDSKKHALHDVSFKIEPGETVAFVGHSGAGKSTIVTLLLRGYDPQSGRIAIDNVDMKLLDLPTYLHQVGYVEQHVELFDDTLRNNILFGVPEAKRAEAERRLPDVILAARIDQFLPRMGAKGLDMMIGEKGIRLSGGERQRVGIARALVKEPRILIFDEATSSLDSENEALIHEAIKTALVGRTGILIAHRLSTIRDADKIIVLEGGRIVGIGKHSILLRSCPQYKNLVERQLADTTKGAPKKRTSETTQGKLAVIPPAHPARTLSRK